MIWVVMDVIIFFTLGATFLVIILVLFVISLLKRNSQKEDSEIYKELRKIQDTLEKKLK